MKEKARGIVNKLVSLMPAYSTREGGFIRDDGELYWLVASPPRPLASHKGGFYLHSYEEGKTSVWGDYLHPDVCDAEFVQSINARFIIEHEDELRSLALATTSPE